MEAGGPEVSNVLDRATSTQSPFLFLSSGRTQELRPSELLS
jgi:hypothetical protein